MCLTTGADAEVIGCESVLSVQEPRPTAPGVAGQRHRPALSVAEPGNRVAQQLGLGALADEREDCPGGEVRGVPHHELRAPVVGADLTGEDKAAVE